MLGRQLSLLLEKICKAGPTPKGPTAWSAGSKANFVPGNDPPHPTVIGEAPNVEVLRQWKGPEHLQAATDCVTQFLDRHTPK